MQWRLLRPLLAHAALLVGVSSFEADYFLSLLHLSPKQFRVIPNGANAGANMDAINRVPIQGTLIVSVGRLERYKGHHRLIAALPKIREWRADARLLILGKGPYEATLWKMAQSAGVAEYVDIRSVAPGDRQAMTDMLAQASLVTLLSEYEAHPVAVMEALALQRPVLVADTSGLRELAEQGLVRSIPLHAPAEKVALAVQQQIETPVMPSLECSLPTWDDCARQLQALYTSIVRGEACVS